MEYKNDPDRVVYCLLRYDQAPNIFRAQYFANGGMRWPLVTMLQDLELCGKWAKLPWLVKPLLTAENLSLYIIL